MCKHLDLRIVGKLVYITKNNAKKAWEQYNFGYKFNKK